MAKKGKSFDKRPPQDSPAPVSDPYEEAKQFFSGLKKDFQADDMDFLHPEHDAGPLGPEQTKVPVTSVDDQYKAEEDPTPRPEMPPPREVPSIDVVVEEHHESLSDDEYPEDLIGPDEETPVPEPVTPPKEDEAPEEIIIEDDTPEMTVIKEPVQRVEQVPLQSPPDDGAEDYLQEVQQQESLHEQFARALSTKEVSPATQLVISQFSSHYAAAKAMLEQRKHDPAHDHYTKMLRHYEELKGHQVSDIHKAIAHHGLEEIYDGLKAAEEHPPISKRTFVTMMIATVLLLLVGVTLVMNPSISGLTVLEQSIPSYTGPTSYEIFGPRKIELGDQFMISSENLALLATRSEHVDVQVDGTGIIVIPEPGFSGDEDVTVMAINTALTPHRITKVPLRFIVR